jgi:hypothetical protein
MKRRDRTEYMRAYRESRREQAKEYARAWRADDPDRARATQRASYLRYRDSRIAANKRYVAAHSAELNDYRKKWLASDPDRERLYAAKRLIRAATGMRIASIPSELAEAKAAQLAVIRAVKRAAQGMPPEGPRREGGSGASAPASPVPKECAPNQSKEPTP